MKIKILLTSVLMLCGMSSAFAQEDSYVAVDTVRSDGVFVLERTVGFGGKHNRVKLDFDFGCYISEFVDRDGDGHRGIFACGVSIAYEHVFKSGYGFGLNFIRDFGSDCIMTQYLGPSFVCYKSVGKWTYGYSLGLGYGRYTFDSYRLGYDDRGGLGYFVQVEGERRFNKWIGVGAGLRVFNITAQKPEGVSESFGRYGTGFVNFTIGPRFYF